MTGKFIILEIETDNVVKKIPPEFIKKWAQEFRHKFDLKELDRSNLELLIRKMLRDLEFKLSSWEDY